MIRARSRLQAFAFWDLSTFLLNGSLFVLVGLQMPRAVRNLDDVTVGHAIVVALTVTGVVVVTRLGWVHVITLVVRTVDRRPAQRSRRVDWRQRTASGWAGFRGAVSLAAALAVPTTIGDGDPFPDRDLIIFTTSVVILLTILVQGTTLPAVIRWARLPEDTDRSDELQFARTRAAQAGLNAIPQVAAELGIDDELMRRVLADYEEHALWLRADEDSADGQAAAEQRDLERQLRLRVLEHKRQAVTEAQCQPDRRHRAARAAGDHGSRGSSPARTAAHRVRPYSLLATERSRGLASR